PSEPPARIDVERKLASGNCATSKKSGDLRWLVSFSSSAKSESVATRTSMALRSTASGWSVMEPETVRKPPSWVWVTFAPMYPTEDFAGSSVSCSAGPAGSTTGATAALTSSTCARGASGTSEQAVRARAEPSATDNDRDFIMIQFLEGLDMGASAPESPWDGPRCQSVTSFSSEPPSRPPRSLRYKRRMALTHQDWTVLEHGPLTPLATNLRWVSGALPHMSLRRTMLVARRADGGLVVHNPIALAPAAQAELDAMGPVR